MDNNNLQNDSQQRDHIDFIALFKTLWQRRKVFYWVWPITFVVSAALILCVPRYYKCDVIIAPEAPSSGTSGSMVALASSFGFDMNSLSNMDAIYPMIYPNVVKSPDFLIHLFDIPVKTSDDEFEGTYYQYLRDVTKKPFWARWKGSIKKSLRPKNTPISIANNNTDGINIFYLSDAQWDILTSMQDNIRCAYDKKTQIITFSVKAQDRLVCAIMADSVCTALQHFIIGYRTQKARADLLYYESVMNDAYEEYQQASEKYVSYVDSHRDMNTQQYRIVATNLEQEMEIKQSAYSSFQKQYMATQARIQENTPVYTVVQSASIPPLPAGPRRTIFVLAMLILATFVAGCVVCKELLVEMLF